MIKIFGMVSILAIINSRCNNSGTQGKIQSEGYSDTNGYYFNLFKEGTNTTKRRFYYKNLGTYEILTIYKNSNYFTAIVIDSTKKNFVKSIKGSLLNKTYGHSFEFYDNGNIKDYYYFVGDGSTYDYGRTYSQDGILIKEEGNPFVDQICNNDSCTLLFSVVFYSNIIAHTLDEQGNSQSLLLKKSNFQPLLYETEIQNDHKILFLTLDCNNGSDQKFISFRDTLNLK